MTEAESVKVEVNINYQVTVDPPEYVSDPPLGTGGPPPDADTGGAVVDHTRASSDYKIDTRYPRSIEGIIRIIIFPVAIIGVILNVIGGSLFGSSGVFFFIAVGHLIYISFVFAIEMFVPNIYVHRLIDGIVTAVYAFLWFVTSLIVVIFAGILSNVVFGVSAVFGFICCGLAGFGAFFAFKTRREFEGGVRGSQPVIFI